MLEGISRRTVLELCAALRIPLRIGPLPVAEFRAADEVFLTSTGGGVLPIARLDGVALPQAPGQVTSRLSEAYWALHEAPAMREPVDYGHDGGRARLGLAFANRWHAAAGRRGSPPTQSSISR